MHPQSTTTTRNRQQAVMTMALWPAVMMMPMADVTLSVATGMTSRLCAGTLSGQDIATLEVSDECGTSCSSSRSSASCGHELPGKVINFITDTVKFLTVEVRINNKLATAIIDTGAQASIISLQLVDKLNLPIYSDF